jgi:hypothetical protein
MRGWEDSEIKTLLAWMADNRELLGGSTKLWTSRAKAAVFADNQNVDVKKIKAKYHNMRAGWKAAKKLQEQSGFGVTEDRCTTSANGRICPFFAIVEHQLLIQFS